MLFAVMLLKEIGAPIPVPGDLLMIVAGARAATGILSLWGVLLATLVAGLVGAFIQYFLARGPGRGFIYRFGKYVGLTPPRLDKASAAIKGRGWVAVALGRALPGLRIGAVTSCGLSGVPLGTFALGLFAGTVLCVGFHTMLGYLAGLSVTALFDELNVSLWALLLALALVGLLGWLLIRARKRRAGVRSEDDTAPVFDWADSCCSACLTAGALERRLVGGQARMAV